MIVKSKAANVLIIAAICASAAHAAVPITGKWVTAEKNAVVEIYPCGATICGKIAKFLVTPPQGAGQKDVNNPDKALRGRTLLGMNILSGFSAKGDQWNGKIYDPKAGKTYRSVVYKGTSGNLIVKGCIGPFCQSQTWTPAR
jgi:uncharacterized protein (DUF2147 family)